MNILSCSDFFTPVYVLHCYSSNGDFWDILAKTKQIYIAILGATCYTSDEAVDVTSEKFPLVQHVRLQWNFIMERNRKLRLW